MGVDLSISLPYNCAFGTHSRDLTPLVASHIPNNWLTSETPLKLKSQRAVVCLYFAKACIGITPLDFLYYND